MSIKYESDHEMSGLIALGTTLRCKLPPCHIWIVLSDPARTGGRIVIVNFTTLRENTVDVACILVPSDYPLLKHPSTVAFSRHRSGVASALEAAVHRSEFAVLQPVSPAVLRRILDAARVSPQLPPADMVLLG